MKTRSLKMLKSTIAILIAIGLSFSSNAQSAKLTYIIVPGYFNTNPSAPSPCNTFIQCSNIFGPICSVTIFGITYQVFGKEFEDDNICPIVLYRL